MNYCKNFRIRTKNKKNYFYCTKQRKVIEKEECYKCSLVEPREYKNNIHKKVEKLKKSTLQKKSPLKSGRMKTKSKKLAKLERSRFSVFSDNKDKCMFCPSTTNLTWHEIFRGRNRANSMKYGLCLRMCLYCHEEKQEDTIFNDFWHRQAQEYFEKDIGSREEFIYIFKRNYIIKKEEDDI